MEHSKEVRARYNVHARKAKSRRIPFLLTIDEWWSIWEASGRWEQRGRKRGQYVMARPGDKGPYEIGNVVIIPQGDNHREFNHSRRGVKLGKKRPPGMLF